MGRERAIQGLMAGVGLLSAFLVGAYWLPAEHIFDVRQTYLPLHTLMEFTAMAVAVMVFALTWTLYRRDDARLLALGTGFLLVAVVDFAHTLSYDGMPVFVTPSGPEKAINFWLMARLFSALALLLFAFLPARPAARWVAPAGLLASGTLAALTWWVGLWHAERLPRTFVPGQGLTDFKLGAEYGLVLLFAVAASDWCSRPGPRAPSAPRSWRPRPGPWRCRNCSSRSTATSRTS